MWCVKASFSKIWLNFQCVWVDAQLARLHSGQHNTGTVVWDSCVELTTQLVPINGHHVRLLCGSFCEFHSALKPVPIHILKIPSREVCSGGG